ncbi:MAG: hypothetical protein ACM336_14750 [Acidobacteriota bacterium]
MMTFGMLLALPAMSCAQDRRPAADQQSARNRNVGRRQADDREQQHKTPEGVTGDRTPRRLESVTWNSVKHELTWVISRGEKKEGASYKALASENYLINMDDATMSFSGEMRRFSKEEAANVHVLMDLIAKYAVDSTVWWDDGQGEPVNGDGKGNKQPEKHRPARPSDADVAILHVAARGSACPQVRLSPAQLQKTIRETEEKLRELKRMQADAEGSRLHLASYAAQAY